MILCDLIFRRAIDKLTKLLVVIVACTSLSLFVLLISDCELRCISLFYVGV